MLYSIENLIHTASSTQTQLSNGKWVCARPVNYKYDSIFERIKHAWLVFTGKADAITWEGQ